MFAKKSNHSSVKQKQYKERLTADISTVSLLINDHLLFKEYFITIHNTDYSASALNASSRSSMISSIFSVPIERRIVFGLMPWSKSSASLHSE